jgi:hypothetical protein
MADHASLQFVLRVCRGHHHQSRGSNLDRRHPYLEMHPIASSDQMIFRLRPQSADGLSDVFEFCGIGLLTLSIAVYSGEQGVRFYAVIGGRKP